MSKLIGSRVRSRLIQKIPENKERGTKAPLLNLSNVNPEAGQALDH